MPPRSIVQPVNVATPLTAATVIPPAHARMAPAGLGGVISSVIAADWPLETVFPPASWTATLVAGVRTCCAVPLVGWVRKASFAAGPTETVNVLLSACVSAGLVARSR